MRPGGFSTTETAFPRVPLEKTADLETVSGPGTPGEEPVNKAPLP